MEGFIRGTSETPIDLLEILPATLKGFSSKDQQRAFGESWQEKHGRFVQFPWETTEERGRRREIFEKVTKKPEPPPMNMSKEVAERELKTLWAEYTPKHPDEARLKSICDQINALEKLVGREPTDFTKTYDDRRRVGEAKLRDQFKKYSAEDITSRKKIVAKISNLPLLRMIRDTEEVKEIVDLAIQRVAQLELE